MWKHDILFQRDVSTYSTNRKSVGLKFNFQINVVDYFRSDPRMSNTKNSENPLPPCFSLGFFLSLKVQTTPAVRVQV